LKSFLEASDGQKTTKLFGHVIGPSDVKCHMWPESGDSDVGHVPVAAFNKDVAGLKAVCKICYLIGLNKVVTVFDTDMTHLEGNLLLYGKPGREGFFLQPVQRIF